MKKSSFLKVLQEIVKLHLLEEKIKSLWKDGHLLAKASQAPMESWSSPCIWCILLDRSKSDHRPQHPPWPVSSEASDPLSFHWLTWITLLLCFEVWNKFASRRQKPQQSSYKMCCWKHWTSINIRKNPKCLWIKGNYSTPESQRF